MHRGKCIHIVATSKALVIIALYLSMLHVTKQLRLTVIKVHSPNQNTQHVTEIQALKVTGIDNTTQLHRNIIACNDVGKFDKFKFI